MDQRGSIKGVEGAASCGRSAETSFLVDFAAFRKREKFPFRRFQIVKASCSRITFGSPNLYNIRTSPEPTAGLQYGISGVIRLGCFYIVEGCCSSDIPRLHFASPASNSLEFFLQKRLHTPTIGLNRFE